MLCSESLQRCEFTAGSSFGISKTTTPNMGYHVFYREPALPAGGHLASRVFLM
jgi:hypothetical protein